MLVALDGDNHGALLISSVKGILQDNGFHLTKFVANDNSLLRNIEHVDICTDSDDLQLSDSKTLVVMWNVNSDYFYFKVNLVKHDVLSRRIMLSIIASIFDPLGLISPILVAGKVIFQQATMLKLSWDCPLPSDVCIKWNSWLDTLSLLSNVHIPRCVKLLSYNDSYFELHCFSDASQYSYGCCIYLRCVGKYGIHSSLLYAKHRLAPIQSTTIPRLELQAAVLSVKVCDTVCKQLDISISRCNYWVDSMIVLSYIRNTSRRFKVFVANRLSDIHSLSDIVDWCHISGINNPADIVSRGSPPDVLNKDMWLHGPLFLRQYRSEWSLPESASIPLNDDDVEVRLKTVVLACKQNVIPHPIDTLCIHFSSWYRVKKALAWILRVRDFLLHCPRCSNDLSVGRYQEC